jgi:hypothetical protein
VDFPNREGDYFAELRSINHTYRSELAKHVGRALNMFLNKQCPADYDGQKQLVVNVNSLLREFGLSIEHGGSPCLLRAQQSGGANMYRLETQDERRTRPLSAVNLEKILPLTLMEEPPRGVSGNKRPALFKES